MSKGKNGEGYCPCGDVKRATCNVCGRHLCGWHHAMGPFSDGEGGVEVAPVCWPKCDAPWWTEKIDTGHATLTGYGR